MSLRRRVALVVSTVVVVVVRGRRGSRHRRTRRVPIEVDLGGFRCRGRPWRRTGTGNSGSRRERDRKRGTGIVGEHLHVGEAASGTDTTGRRETRDAHGIGKGHRGTPRVRTREERRAEQHKHHTIRARQGGGSTHDTTKLGHEGGPGSSSTCMERSKERAWQGVGGARREGEARGGRPGAEARCRGPRAEA